MATFLKPDYAGGRIPLATGEVIVGAIFPPTGPRAGYRWRLFQCFDVPPMESRAEDEETARRELKDAFHQRLETMGLCTRKATLEVAARICRIQAETLPLRIHEGALACETALTQEAEK